MRYTVPGTIDPDRMAEEQVVRFRVGEVMQNGSINVWLDDRRMVHKKRRVMAPGEMEQVILKKEWFDDPVNTIVIESGKEKE